MLQELFLEWTHDPQRIRPRPNWHRKIRTDPRERQLRQPCLTQLLLRYGLREVQQRIWKWIQGFNSKQISKIPSKRTKIKLKLRKRKTTKKPTDEKAPAIVEDPSPSKQKKNPLVASLDKAECSSGAIPQPANNNDKNESRQNTWTEPYVLQNFFNISSKF